MHPTTTLALFTPNAPTLLIMLAIGILLFGKRLPEIGKSLAKGIREFQGGLNDISNEVTGSFMHEQPSGAMTQRQSPKLLPQPKPELAEGDGPIV